LANWMHEVSQLIHEAAERQSQEAIVKESAPRLYSGLESVVREQVGNANNMFFSGKPVLEFGYEGNARTGSHFMVYKRTLPALASKLQSAFDGNLLVITLHEKREPEGEYEEVGRDELRVIYDSSEHAGRLSREGSTLTLPEAAGVMLKPLVVRALGLHKGSVTR
jgi:hypothetical protein